MMSVQKLTTGIPYIALGAFAAYLGFCWNASGPQSHLLPMMFSMVLAMGLAVIGVAVLSQSRGRLVRPGACMAEERAGDEERYGGAALLGHEMRNYLCTLKGNARLLRQRAQGTDSDIIDRIDRVVEKLESFTKSMADSADATSSGVLWQLRLGDAAKACVKTHFPGSASDDARFQWEIQDSSSTLLGDPDRMEQVFLNLYSNALEAGAPHVVTSVQRTGDNLRLRIEDDGKGCPPEDLARIFEPFFTTKSGPARRGLGMFIVQSIVENHGGRIQVQSKNGIAAGSHGLIFTLDFPLSLSIPMAGSGNPFPPKEIDTVSLPWLLALPEPF